MTHPIISDWTRPVPEPYDRARHGSWKRYVQSLPLGTRNVSRCGVRSELKDGRVRTWNRYAYGPLTTDPEVSPWPPDEAWSDWKLVQDEDAGAKSA